MAGLLEKSRKAITRVFGDKENAHAHLTPDSVVQRSSAAISPFEPFIEQIPTTREWIIDQLSGGANPISYFLGLLPFLGWLRRYNKRWLVADLIAGCTLSLVMIPQGLSYAILANISPEFGLFTTFAGASLYWLFGTSKDICVGATAVISLLVGKTGMNVVDRYPNFTLEEIAKTQAFLSGCVFLVLGLLRLGWIVELIPHVAISAFVTAAAITIALGQVPNLLGITGVNTRGSAYQVFIDSCRGLRRVKIDAAVGLTALLLLMSIKRLFGYLAVRTPHRKKTWDTLSSLRLSLTVFLYIVVSYLVNRNLPPEEFKFRILGHIPAGFGHIGPPSFQPDLIRSLLSELPATTIVIIVEHIAIGKSLGQKNDYTIAPSQELVALGGINLAGPFIGAYASTASFGGSALLSKARAKTPLAGIFNAVILVLVLYVLGQALYWTPVATMAALIIHAVISLPMSLSELHKLWLISPPDLVIYSIGLLTSVFSTLENGIYVTTALSACLLFIRLIHGQGQLLGRVQVYQYPNSRSRNTATTDPSLISTTPSRDAFFRIDRKDASNPSVHVESPRPGVFIYRFPEGFNYVNQAQHMEFLYTYVVKETCRTTPLEYKNPGDRPWNEHALCVSSDQPGSETSKPTLKALILDFSTVSNIDTDAIHRLVVLRKQLERWSSPDTVQFHFASVDDRWVRRALVMAGFGYPSQRELEAPIPWSPVFSLAKKNNAPETTPDGVLGGPSSVPRRDIENAEIENSNGEAIPMGPGQLAVTHGVNYPNFHADLSAAVQAVSAFATQGESFVRV
ncbi:sulfate permease [Daldinia caldariorum]|uniref:sulfate permease n=1 Tax=Daldinia caldariorum TaxID=326644 RepID=UPI0020074733|nr:sulfate permease [Daldinia caldariorum]KAI1465847.1 sulfate permease [Daldinia caldariorum]